MTVITKNPEFNAPIEHCLHNVQKVHVEPPFELRVGYFSHPQLSDHGFLRVLVVKDAEVHAFDTGHFQAVNTAREVGNSLIALGNAFKA